MFLSNREIDTAIVLGVDRVKSALRRLGVRDIAKETVVVAGTNGKGSTCLYLESLLLSVGSKVFTYLSPHVYSFCERIRINGKPICSYEFDESYKSVGSLLGDLWNTLTPFEKFTVAALYIASKIDFDVAILEVGMGGRLDATNVFDNRFSAVVSIGFDHAEYLGNTIEKIAYEKAGVIKNGSSVVIGEVGEKPKQVILEVARERQAKVYSLGVDFDYKVTKVSSTAISFVYEGFASFMREVSLKTFNPVFAHNASIAITLYRLLYDGSQVEHIDFTALSQVVIPGRSEVVVKGNATIILDVAHNFHALSKLFTIVRQVFYDPIWFISPVEGKDWYKLLELVGKSYKYFLIENPERGLFKDKLRTYGEVIDLDRAVDIALNSGVTSVFTGSFYIVREVRKKVV
ncbi:MAG: Mur ligase family protein [candidate division WOR-3 bacterium]